MISVLVVLVGLLLLAGLWFNVPILVMVAGVLLLFRITYLLEEVACWLCFHCRLLDPRDGDPEEDEKDAT